MKLSHVNRLTVGAAAMVLAVAGGYVARAESDHAVNAHPAPAPVASAPASFADIVQKVAPAVVSIEVDSAVAFGAGHIAAGHGDDHGGGKR